MRYYILDSNGEPMTVDLLEWGRWMETASRRVAQDHIGGARISTVFLGLDHSYGLGGGPPVLWETMIFGGKHDQYQDRYTSRADAVAGHAKAVAMVEAGNIDPDPIDVEEEREKAYEAQCRRDGVEP